MKALITKIERNNTKIRKQQQAVMDRVMSDLQEQNQGTPANVDHRGMPHAPFDGYLCDDTPYAKGQFIPSGDNIGGTNRIHKGRVKMSPKIAKALTSPLAGVGVSLSCGKTWGQPEVCFAYLETCHPSNIRIIESHFEQIEAKGKAALQKKLDKVWDAKCAKSEHIGELKQRLTLVATITRVVAYEGISYSYYDDGMRTIIELTDKEGNVLTYFGNGNNIGDKGETVTIKATVKDHTVYKGLKQTVIQRPKLVE
jgi:hypothetical protein